MKGPSPTAGPPAGSKAASVVGVTDGDTVEVRFDTGATESVRLIGINAPEAGERFADEATAALEALLAGGEVYLASDVSNRDQYGRLLRYMWLPDGSLVNAELVADGFATAEKFPPNVAHTGKLELEMHEAQRARRGFWDACGPATGDPYIE